jgi:hypothetical protein
MPPHAAWRHGGEYQPPIGLEVAGRKQIGVQAGLFGTAT